MHKRVLFIDTTHEILPKRLLAMGFEIDYLKKEERGNIYNIASNYMGIIIRSGIPINRPFIDAASNLKFIARVGAGLENIDVEYAQSKGIACINSPEGNRDAVAEHTLGMLLALNNKLLTVDAEVRKGIWLREENRGVEIKGKTIAIIGYGNMGGAVCERLMGFGAHIIAYDKYKSNFSSSLVKEVDMQEVFASADIVSMHIPLTEETKYLCNKAWFAAFRKSIVFVNTARGEIVNTADLVNAMKDNKVVGACLDVLEYEGSSFEQLNEGFMSNEFDYLKTSERVILSPHIGGWTHESNIKLSEVIADKIEVLVEEQGLL